MEGELFGVVGVVGQRLLLLLLLLLSQAAGNEGAWWRGFSSEERRGVRAIVQMGVVGVLRAAAAERGWGWATRERGVVVWGVRRGSGRGSGRAR